MNFEYVSLSNEGRIRKKQSNKRFNEYKGSNKDIACIQIHKEFKKFGYQFR